MASFFEKLTGAEQEQEKLKKSKITKPQVGETKTRGGSTSSKKITKKTMPRPKKIKQETTLTEPEIEKPEEKDWLEETGGEEEGQLTIDVYQTDSEIVIKSTVAGVNPEDIDISITNDMVTLRGRRTKDEAVETENYFYQELYWGSFSRSVILPAEIDSDKSKATIKNGILTIRLPKLAKSKTKKITVKTLN